MPVSYLHAVYDFQLLQPIMSFQETMRHIGSYQCDEDHPFHDRPPPEQTADHTQRIDRQAKGPQTTV